MQYLKFKVLNFKGIQELEFDLSESPLSPIYLLVGLNESGKTTILESLSFFYDNLSKEKELTLRPNVVDDVHDLIPKSKKDNFNESISIECFFKFDQEDITLLKKFFSKHKARVDVINDTFSICTSYEFKNSQFQKKSNIWDIDIKLRQARQTRTRKLSDNQPLWDDTYQYVVDLIPPLIYYPNFLFDFPDKIYLEEMPAEGKQQTFYRRVLQDILDSIQNNLNIDTHIVSRVKSAKPQDRDACESVINKMGDQITRLLVNKKFSIFKKGTKRKDIVVTYPRIEAEGQKCYVELKLKEG